MEPDSKDYLLDYLLKNPKAVGGRVMTTTITPGRIVMYRGKFGFNALRPALVVCTVDTLDPRGVATGEVTALDSQEHVHLQVFTPSERIAFYEPNIPYWSGHIEEMPPGYWTWPMRA